MTRAGSRSSSAGPRARRSTPTSTTPHVAALLERAEELFGDSGDITVFEAVPGGEDSKGSLAAHAGD